MSDGGGGNRACSLVATLEMLQHCWSCLWPDVEQMVDEVGKGTHGGGGTTHAERGSLPVV